MKSFTKSNFNSTLNFLLEVTTIPLVTSWPKKFNCRLYNKLPTRCSCRRNAKQLMFLRSRQRSKGYDLKLSKLSQRRTREHHPPIRRLCRNSSKISKPRNEAGESWNRRCCVLATRSTNLCRNLHTSVELSCFVDMFFNLLL